MLRPIAWSCRTKNEWWINEWKWWECSLSSPSRPFLMKASIWFHLFKTSDMFRLPKLQRKERKINNKAQQWLHSEFYACINTMLETAITIQAASYLESTSCFKRNFWANETGRYHRHVIQKMRTCARCVCVHSRRHVNASSERWNVCSSEHSLIKRV